MLSSTLPRFVPSCGGLAVSCSPHLALLLAVGKSAFGLVVLRHALLQRPARSVIYISSKTPDKWLFRADSGRDGHDVHRFDHDSMTKVLRDPSTVFIADSICPPQVDAFTIMITSPKRDRYKDFQNAPPCSMIEFPPFSWAEIRAMHDTCFPGISEATVRENYALAGGIPRAVFTETPASLRADVTGALKKVINLDDVVRQMRVRSIEYVTSFSHRSIHMLPRGALPCIPGELRLSPRSLEFYEPAGLDFASRMVAQRVYAALDDRSVHRLHALLSSGPSSDVNAAIYSKLYEPAALSVLNKGCKLTCRNMQTGALSLLDVPPSAERVFNTVSDLAELFAADSKQLLVPSSKSFTAIDAVLPGGRLAIVTVNLEHDVQLRGRGTRSSEGLLLAHEGLYPLAGPASDIELYWILPPSRYAELARLDAGDAMPFPLIIPEEQDARAEEARLARAAKLAARRASAPRARVKVRAAAMKAVQDLVDFRTALHPRAETWKVLKKRVKHFAVCLLFSEAAAKP